MRLIVPWGNLQGDYIFAQISLCISLLAPSGALYVTVHHYSSVAITFSIFTHPTLKLNKLNNLTQRLSYDGEFPRSQTSLFLCICVCLFVCLFTIISYCRSACSVVISSQTTRPCFCASVCICLFTTISYSSSVRAAFSLVRVASVFVCFYCFHHIILQLSACSVVISAGSGRVGSLSLSESAIHTMLPYQYHTMAGQYNTMVPYHNIPWYQTMAPHSAIPCHDTSPWHTIVLCHTIQQYHIWSVFAISSPTLPCLSSTYHQLPILNIQAAAPQLMDIFTYPLAFPSLS